MSALDKVLRAAQSAGVAHNGGAGGQYILVATEAQLLRFANEMFRGYEPLPIILNEAARTIRHMAVDEFERLQVRHFLCDELEGAALMMLDSLGVPR